MAGRAAQAAGGAAVRTATHALADFVVTATVPNAEVHATVRTAFIDTMAVALAATGTPLIRAVRDALAPSKTGVSLLGGGRNAAPTAAFFNATAGHALDFDDMTDSIRGHFSVISVMAMFAVLEGEATQPAPGAVADAYAVGQQVAASVGAGVGLREHYTRGWHTTATLGGLGATASLARLIGLDTAQTMSALGLVASTASGLRQNFGSDTKPLHAGHAAEQAVRAVHLARRGVTAAPDSIGGSAGLLAVFAVQPQVGALLEELAGPWHTAAKGANTKLYPCCYELQRSAAAAAELAPTLDVEEIVSIRLTLNPRATEPLILDGYANGREAQFSPGYVIATMLLFGSVDLEAFEPDAVSDEKTRRLATLVSIEEATVPPFGDAAWVDGYAVLEIVTKDGAVRTSRVDAPPGHFSNPVTHEQLENKVSECLAFGGYNPDPEFLFAGTDELLATSDPKRLSSALQSLVTKG